MERLNRHFLSGVSGSMANRIELGKGLKFEIEI